MLRTLDLDLDANSICNLFQASCAVAQFATTDRIGEDSDDIIQARINVLPYRHCRVQHNLPSEVLI